MYALIEGQCWNAQTNDSLDDPPVPSPRPPHVDLPSVPWPLRPSRTESIPNFFPNVKDMTYVKYTSNNNQINQQTKKNTHQSKQQPTHKSKNNQANNPTKKGAISPQNQSPASFSTSTRCISSEPGQDLWEWYIFCLPPKQEQPQIGLNVVYLSHGSSGLANELFHPYMSRICDTSRGIKLTN